VLSALGRISRAGRVSEVRVAEALGDLATAPIQRHPLPPLVAGAWARRHNISLRDALYVELASQLGATVVTTDARLAAATSLAELIS
jgi:predicted nucleic acid-binding protein